jgi:hypothetical protein
VLVFSFGLTIVGCNTDEGAGGASKPADKPAGAPADKPK